MALDRYIPWAVHINGTPIPVNPDSLRCDSEPSTVEIRAGGRMAPNVVQVVKKRAFFRFSTTDLAAISPLAWTYFASGETIESVAIYYRQVNENGGLGSYISYTMSKGVIIPVSLTGPIDQPAEVELLVLGIFTSGAAVTKGTSSGDRAVVTKAFFPFQFVIDSDTLAQIGLRSINITWNYQVDDDDQWEPAHFTYEQRQFTGEATLKDVDQLTIARLEAGAVTTTLSGVFRNRNSTGTTITQAIGTAKIFVGTNGRDATLRFSEVANTADS